MSSTFDQGTGLAPLYRLQGLTWLPVLLMAAIPIALFWRSLVGITGFWELEEYSHAYLIPFLSAFMVWQRRHELAALPYEGSFWGPIVVALGVAGFIVGQLSAITSVDYYAIWFALAGLALSLLGVRGFKLVLPAIVLLLLAIPLPNFIYANLSAELQLISSQLGVAVIRLFGISVHLEGNVIDLGAMKLQVVEACNGLRYLFPLMTLGFIAACFFRAPMWMRVTVFLSTMPITVLMNSFRIGVIGVLVDRFGRSHAEGFLHDFEGWVIFMACFGVLVAEMWLLVRASGDKRPFAEIFAIDTSVPATADRPVRDRTLPRSAWIALALVCLSAIPVLALPHREEARPTREDFGAFPLQVDAWKGRPDRLDADVLQYLKLDDYVLANFVRTGGEAINFYSAYYASQRTGQSAHSPRSCMPGGGWLMEDLTRTMLPVEVGGRPLEVNRVVIRRGDSAQLVYYWFQQRGRTITSEYLVKWYIFVDSLLRNRSDGAMVRLVTPLAKGEDMARADQRLIDFAASVSRELPKYVPN
jgi:exosortase D (VPLPA-CTERM-specific)